MFADLAHFAVCVLCSAPAVPRLCSQGPAGVFGASHSSHARFAPAVALTGQRPCAPRCALLTCVPAAAGANSLGAHWQSVKGQLTTLVLDDGHHFEGYTRADGETLDGGPTGFAIKDSFEGPGTWMNAGTAAPFDGEYEAFRCVCLLHACLHGVAGPSARRSHVCTHMMRGRLSGSRQWFIHLLTSGVSVPYASSAHALRLY